MKPYRSQDEVHQYDMDGNYINTFRNIREASVLVGNGLTSTIQSNIAGRGHQAFGFIWHKAKVKNVKKINDERFIHYYERDNHE